jgi:hypothetical protein
VNHNTPKNPTLCPPFPVDKIWSLRVYAVIPYWPQWKQVVTIQIVVGGKLWRILSDCIGFVFPSSRSAVNCWEIEKWLLQ